MNFENINTVISVNKIEEILGNPEKRYFSNGFRNICFEYKDIVFKQNSIECKLDFSVDNLWSKKGNQSLKPHIGIVEYYAVSVYLSEILLKAQLGLSDSEISNGWVTDFTIKTRPTTDITVDSVDFKAQLISSSYINSSYCGDRSIIDITFGSITIVLVINHPSPKPVRNLSFDYSIFTNFQKPSLYNSGYKRAIHKIKNVQINVPHLQASASVSIKNKISNDRMRGLGSNYLGSNLLTDHYLTTGQLIQVLLYELDNINRDESNNLWVREVKTHYSEPFYRNTSEIFIKVTDTKIVNLKNDEWRLATIEAKQENISSVIKVSHILPSKTK